MLKEFFEDLALAFREAMTEAKPKRKKGAHLRLIKFEDERPDRNETSTASGL